MPEVCTTDLSQPVVIIWQSVALVLIYESNVDADVVARVQLVWQRGTSYCTRFVTVPSVSRWSPELDSSKDGMEASRIATANFGYEKKEGRSKEHIFHHLFPRRE